MITSRRVVAVERERQAGTQDGRKRTTNNENAPPRAPRARRVESYFTWGKSHSVYAFLFMAVSLCFGGGWTGWLFVRFVWLGVFWTLGIRTLSANGLIILEFISRVLFWWSTSAIWAEGWGNGTDGWGRKMYQAARIFVCYVWIVCVCDENRAGVFELMGGRRWRGRTPKRFRSFLSFLVSSLHKGSESATVKLRLRPECLRCTASQTVWRIL